MSQKINLLEDDGYAEFEFGDGQVAKLDLFRAHNAYAVLADAHPDAEAVALGDAWCAWLEQAGFPHVSHGLGFQVAAKVQELVADFKKKRLGDSSENAGSAGSTG